MSTPPSDSPVPGHKLRQVWTLEEDRLLSEAKNAPVSWHKVAAHLPGRNNKDCRKRWHYSIANTIRKGTWLREEDEKLREAVDLYGARWSKIAEAVGTRNGDQCWKRWYDCLDPRIDKSPWTTEEDTKLLHLVAQTGRNWSDIVHQHFPNRTSLAAKNRYSILQRKQDGGGGGGGSRSNSSSRGSSAVRHHTRARIRPSPSASASATPSLSSSPGPYLGVATTPSTTALSTPEPEFLGVGEEWMALTAAEVDEMLYRGAAQQGLPVGGGGLDYEYGFGPEAGWVAAGGSSQQQDQQNQHQAWMQQQDGFDVGLVDPQIQTCSAVGYGDAGYYAQGQQQQLEAPGYGYNMLGVYQNEVQIQVTQPGMYDGSSGLVSQGQMGSWQGGYNAEGW
ncbi:Homeodomain-like protein [Chaetomium fimeti]|uniref:Homeodomain-like protein n=1 Tax=Chaetomium fimeti TaxID=1854472 RepID=A0AAE0HLE2_9PEZI|nr:Homeodomain-like protein [Chaetomium fimeti]